MMSSDCDGSKARWVRVTAAMCDHRIFRGEPYDRRSAWLWLIANAAWNDHRVRTRGGMVTIKRGEVIAGSEQLASIWGWSRKRVRTFLAELEAEGMVSKGPDRGQLVTILTICNYEKYQTVPANEGPDMGQIGARKRARSGPENGPDNGPDADIVTTCNYEKFQTEPEIGARKRARSGPEKGPAKGPHSTSYIIENRDDTRARAHARPADGAPTAGPGASREVAGLGNGEPEARVSLDNGRIVLANGLRAYWLAKFGGDAERLDLALMQVAAYVQPASVRPLEAQVSAQLARIAAEKLDRDRRYERAVTSRAPPGGTQPQRVSDILRRLREGAE
jgi:hypothetical protein